MDMIDELANRSTRKDRVLKTLEDASPEWVDGHVLCHPKIGGSEGLRRVRELRAAGHNIEMRTLADRTTRQYRIVTPGTLFG